MGSREFDDEVPPANTGVPVRLGLSQFQHMGAVSWAALGLVSVSLIVASGLSAFSGIIAPLMVSVILAALIEPLILVLRRFNIPLGLAVMGALAVAIAVCAGFIAIVIIGFVEQLPEISWALAHGWNALYHWMVSFDIDPSWVGRIRAFIRNFSPRLSSGLFGIVSNTLYGIVTFTAGIFFALFFLFYILRDGKSFRGWIVSLTSWDEDLVIHIDSLVMESLRGYFVGTAITAAITAPLFVVPLVVVKVPFVVPIVILYFLLSFIPFVGAWITGAFAALIALGSSGGQTAAIVVIIALMVSNGTIQNFVSARVFGGALRMHPVFVLVATLIGGAIAGILGMILGAPALLAAQKAWRAVRARKKEAAGSPEQGTIR